MKKRKSRILVLFLTVLLVSVMSCENPFLKKMLVEEEKGKTVPAAPEKPQLPNPQAPRYTITFGVEGGLGTLKATVDGNEINSGDSVEQGKSVVFTAEPAEGYVLEQWTNAGLAITEAGTDKTYTRTVTANADIKVKFKEIPIGTAELTLSPDKLDIKVNVIAVGTVTVEGCTETELQSGTATVLHAKGTLVILKGKITGLYCWGNQLTSLDVQGCTALQKLWCWENQLTTLNVQGLTALKELYCDRNQLTALNVQGLTSLKELYCDRNQLTALNVQGLTSLKELYCDRNQLTALNVQNLISLQYLDCGDNRLTALNVQGLISLQYLNCGDNRLTALNVQGLTALQKLECKYNLLTTLNVQGCTALKELKCWANPLTALNMQGLTALQWLDCSLNDHLTALDVQGLTSLQYLACVENRLTALDVQGLTSLQYLTCRDNQLTELNVQGCTALRTLNCWSNQLNADAFKKLFTDLPKKQDGDGASCVLYTEQTGVTEGNCKDFSTPQDLTDAFNKAKNKKKWKMYKWNGSWPGVEI